MVNKNDKPFNRFNEEIDDLLKNGSEHLRIISNSHSAIIGDQLANVTAWVVRLGHLIRKIYGANSQYFESYKAALSVTGFYSLHSGYCTQFVQMYGIVKAVRHDVTSGLLDDFKRLTQADMFADFLEMGEYLLTEGYKDAAAVIIGTVLENALRNLAEKNGIEIRLESGRAMTIEPLNAQLAKCDVYSKLIQKQITTWAHIRNKSAHGEYSEYNEDNVKSMLIFVQSFSSNYLSLMPASN